MISHWQKDPPEAPFFAVIFISQKSEDLEGYPEMDERMMEMAQQQEGYLGYSSSSTPRGGIFISYWKDEASIAKWRADQEHGRAKAEATRWYAYYHTMITKVESSKIHGQWLEALGGSHL